MFNLKNFAILILATSLIGCCKNDRHFNDDPISKMPTKPIYHRESHNLNLSVYKFINTKGIANTEHVLIKNKLNNLSVLQNSMLSKTDTIDLQINTKHQKWQK